MRERTVMSTRACRSAYRPPRSPCPGRYGGHTDEPRPVRGADFLRGERGGDNPRSTTRRPTGGSCGRRRCLENPPASAVARLHRPPPLAHLSTDGVSVGLVFDPPPPPAAGVQVQGQVQTRWCPRGWVSSDLSAEKRRRRAENRACAFKGAEGGIGGQGRGAERCF